MRPSQFITVDSSDDEGDSDKVSGFVSMVAPNNKEKENRIIIESPLNKISDIYHQRVNGTKNSHRSKLLTNDNDDTVDTKTIENGKETLEIVEIDRNNSDSDDITANSSDITSSGSSMSSIDSINNNNNNNESGMNSDAKLINICESFSKDPWHTVSPIILFGYRHKYSMKQIILSIFAIDHKNKFGIIHNEFANIWTELIPGFIYLFLTYSWIFSKYNEIISNFNVITQIIIILFLPIFGIRALASAYAHATHCYSDKQHRHAWNCDYSSITLDVFGTSLLYICCIFHCSDPSLISMFLFVSMPSMYIINFAITYTNIRKLQGNLLSLLIAFGLYSILFYHYVRLFASGNEYSEQFPKGFTFLWTIGSAVLIIGSQARDRGYPEKFYIKKEILKLLTQLECNVDASNNEINDIEKNNDVKTVMNRFIGNKEENGIKNEIEITKDVINKLKYLYSNDWNITREDHSKRIEIYSIICNAIENECDGGNINPNYANLRCMIKFWYIYLLPSHAIWHLLVALTHFPLLYSWLAFFEMHGDPQSSKIC